MAARRQVLQHLEASAEAYWQVPDVRFVRRRRERRSRRRRFAYATTIWTKTTPKTWPSPTTKSTTKKSWDDGEVEELYGAAYEDMVYRDSTDDGFDADMIDEGGVSSEFELEEEAQRLGQRLEFLSTVARLWRHVAIAWKMRRRERARPPSAARKLVQRGHDPLRPPAGAGRRRQSLPDLAAQRLARIDGRVRPPANDQGFAARAHHRHVRRNRRAPAG